MTTQTKSRYNPNAVRRCVRIEATTADHVVIFKSKSMTQADGLDRYHPSIDTETGACRCDCGHFTYRLRVANVWDGDTQCKHLVRAVANLERRGELPRNPAAVCPSDDDISDIFD